MIRAYGQFWNPDMVDWKPGRGKKCSLKGTGIHPAKTAKNPIDIDGWEQRGIYVLHNNYKTVYIGRAAGENMSIGPRLCTHLSDHLEGRWDAFSWYGIDKVNANGELSRFDTRPCPAEEIVKAFEAIAILIADPPLNRRRESLRGAIEVQQAENKDFRTDRQLLEDILKKLPQ